MKSPTEREEVWLDGAPLRWLNFCEVRDRGVEHPDLVTSLARMLEAEWPSVGGVPERLRSLNRVSTAVKTNGLPAFFLLLKEPRTIVGCVCLRHARGEINVEGGGTAAVVYSVLVQLEWRKRDLGRSLMRLACDEAARRGYTYLYLSTPAEGETGEQLERFYSERCGFTRAEQISVLGALEQSLPRGAVAKLEAALARKVRVAQGGMTPSTGRWMRKRLVHRLPQKQRRIAPSDVLRSPLILSTLRQHTVSTERGRWWVCLLTRPIPWERQVGPSCGLSCLYNLRHFFADTSAPGARSAATSSFVVELDRGRVESVVPRVNAGEAPRLSGPPVAWVDHVAPLRRTQESANAESSPADLLAYTREKGFSSEGEMFDATRLGRVAVDTCGLQCDLIQTRVRGEAATPQRSEVRDGVGQRTLAEAIIGRLSAGEVVLFPYDRDRNNLPRVAGGVSAHWCFARGFALPLPRESVSLSAGSQQFLETDLHLICQHGLSHHALVAPFVDFVRSNANLGAVDTGELRSAMPANWMVPGDLRETLANKWLAIRGP